MYYIYVNFSLVMHSFRSFLPIEWFVTNAICLVYLLTL
nr:MAG TPA: hypothetical protein [Crassvirales sp.]